MNPKAISSDILLKLPKYLKSKQLIVGFPYYSSVFRNYQPLAKETQWALTSTYLCIIVKMTRQRLFIFFLPRKHSKLSWTEGRQCEVGAFPTFLEGTCDHMTTFCLIRCKQRCPTAASKNNLPECWCCLLYFPTSFQQNEVAGGPSMVENYKDLNPPESLVEERAHTTLESLLLASNIKREMSHDVVSAVLGAP